MQKSCVLYICLFLVWSCGNGQSPSFQTYINPIIPGDHPDPTLTKIGQYFYTSGSSFNPTPKIYRSTDLVHWEVIAQPVSASWPMYGDNPGGGIWGGHMVLYNGTYYHFFGRGGGNMYFVTADQPEGPWSSPTVMNVPSGMSSLGVDNSIFIDDETGKWYLLTKAGHVNNHIVELGENGQPSDTVLDLTWLNPDSAYGWAEGPVMWKCNDNYYYSFAEHLVGRQYVMFSDTLTDDESAWTVIAPTDNIFTGSPSTFNRPNHISPVVMLEDGTSWTIAHSYHSSSSWYAHGRQGLLCQVTYNDQDFPVIQYPPSIAVQAPTLPSSGIPWMVPKSDMFNSSTLKPDWSFLGYTSSSTYSLTVREGWLYLEPYSGANTIIQNDGEHSYSLITRVDFEPESTSDEAGLRIINGPETHYAKVFSTVNSESENVVAISFESIKYEAENTIGSTIWLKLIRNEHMISGYYSPDGIIWTQIGEPINATNLDIEQTMFNNFTGNQQGLYVRGKLAYFDLYIYRDAYTDIIAQNPANSFGVGQVSSNLGYISNDDWAMYAGVEFGNNTDYLKTPVSFEVIASSASSAGVVEVWLDSIDTGNKITECNISNTGGWNIFQTFTSETEQVSGSHDVYLRFKGVENEQLFRIRSFKFYDEQSTSIGDESQLEKPASFTLHQNYPNPFNSTTTINFNIPHNSDVRITLYNILGKAVEEIVNKNYDAGFHSIKFNATGLASGIYFYKIEAIPVQLSDRSVNNFVRVKKLLLMK